MPIARSRHQRQVDLVNKNRNYSGPRAVGHSGEDKTGTSRGRSRQESSPRRRGRCGAEASVERVGVSGGRRVRQFRVSGRHYADMPGIRRNKLTPKAEKSYRYLVFWKPCGVDVRFTGEREESELDYYVNTPDVLPVNFLDKDAEGLMILTSDPRFRAMLTNPICAEPRTFLVQTENIPSEDVLEAWEDGVALVEGGRTERVDVELIPAPKLPRRSTPIRERKSIPTAWLEVRSISGASRGVRRVSAAFGNPVLRLVLWSFGPISLTGMVAGECRDFRYEEMRWVEAQLEKADEPQKQLALRRFASRHRSRVAPERSSRQRRLSRQASSGFAYRRGGEGEYEESVVRESGRAPKEPRRAERRTASGYRSRGSSSRSGSYGSHSSASRRYGAEATPVRVRRSSYGARHSYGSVRAESGFNDDGHSLDANSDSAYSYERLRGHVSMREQVDYGYPHDFYGHP